VTLERHYSEYCGTRDGLKGKRLNWHAAHCVDITGEGWIRSGRDWNEAGTLCGDRVDGCGMQLE